MDDANLNKSQKFVRILEALQARGGASAQELMVRFSLDDRTLRRYLADLKALDLPVRSVGRGAERRLSLDPSYRRQASSLLELVSLGSGVRIRLPRGHRLRCGHERRTGHPVGAGRARRARTSRSISIASSWPSPSTGRTTAQTPISSMSCSRALYQNPASAVTRRPGPTKRYALHPYTLAVYRHGLYLIARDTNDNKVKTFAIDRFRHFERHRGEHFDYPEDYRPDSLYSDAFGIMGGEPLSVVRFNRRVSVHSRADLHHPGDRPDR